MPRIECPKCEEWVDVTADDFGRVVNCRSCGAAFPAFEPLESEEEHERRLIDEKARRLLRGRSRALVSVSIASLIGSCMFGAAYFLVSISDFWRLNRQEEDELKILGVMTAVLGSVYCLLIMIGASKMHDPRQRKWPIASAIMAISAMVFCLPILVFSLPLCIYGVWALRRLFHPAVLQAVGADWDPGSFADSDDHAGMDQPHGFSNYFSDGYDPVDSNERATVVVEAKRRVRVPATGLKITGIIGMFAAVIVGFVVTLEQFDGYRDQTENAILSLGTFMAITFYFFLVAAGGRALSRLQNRALSLAAATLGAISMAFFGVWTVISIPGLIFGMWAFAALYSREVKHAMRWKRNERRDNRTV